ncbi:MAG: tRNA (N6-threonylcarbamoyladenosine(37)-N6)-methyltransferase TrmO [Bosea sp.]|uniref:tRNA (N6-threonylcarbamoyladenosine(37)-N6)-methyltransferase TrmO n=1 Tax=Bosea sp. (in: a-proteobacteria) TaxID=1871050 RepID=UPI001AC4BCBA|nr:tRNA (N6-threonylcarbamoyladenosine(37)-N6)-methyltransferase TrmO [Bosea sp. (in: a-proteobacteria)]MBN9468482.1 tRNA (N6-threonylcarbamoyladenosine(37)-N6)-methyltransferase TrmO [Bosea sp. (in: a-proteobacteria)]
MLMDPDMRRGEMAVAVPPAIDAGLVFIGRVRTPWATRRECPRRGREDGPVCRLEFFEPWHEALLGTEAFTQLEVLYWLHESRRDLVLQSPANDGRVHGTFALRSPVRPNPIGTSIVTLLAREGPALLVRGLDCVDGTPLLDVKPARFLFAPLAPPKPGVA